MQLVQENYFVVGHHKTLAPYVYLSYDRSMNNNASSDTPLLLDYMYWLDRMLGQYAVNHLDEDGGAGPLDRLRDVLLYANVSYAHITEAERQEYFLSTKPGSKFQWTQLLVWAYASDAEDVDDTYTAADKLLLEHFLKVTEASLLSLAAPALSSL